MEERLKTKSLIQLHQELHHLLAKSYDSVQQKLRHEKDDIKMELMLIDHKFQQLNHNRTRQDDVGDKDDNSLHNRAESSDEDSDSASEIHEPNTITSFLRAVDVQSFDYSEFEVKALGRIADWNARTSTTNIELEWLRSNPCTEGWGVIVERINSAFDFQSETQQDKDRAISYFHYADVAAPAFIIESNNEQAESIAREIEGMVLENVVGNLLFSICSEIFDVGRRSACEVHRGVVRAIYRAADIEDDGTGAANTLLGHLLDLKEERANESYLLRKSGFPSIPKRSSLMQLLDAQLSQQQAGLGQGRIHSQVGSEAGNRRRNDIGCSDLLNNDVNITLPQKRWVGHKVPQVNRSIDGGDSFRNKPRDVGIDSISLSVQQFMTRYVEDEDSASRLFQLESDYWRCWKIKGSKQEIKSVGGSGFLGLRRTRGSTTETVAETAQNLQSIPKPIRLRLPENLPSCIELFPYTDRKQSMLVCGSQQGTLAIWTVPWIEAKSLPGPCLTAASAALPKEERSPIVSIKQAPIGHHRLLTLSSIGHVRLWTLNPLPRNLKNPKHTSQNFFETITNPNPSSVEGFKSTVLASCLLHLKPFDMCFPDRSLSVYNSYQVSQHRSGQERRLTSDRDEAVLERAIKQFDSAKKQNQELKVTSVSFHPSLTFVGRNPAIVVGLASGEIVKFNIDNKIMDLDARVSFLKPFVQSELLHPVDSSGGQLSVRGLNDDQIVGNKVYRELFHFHLNPVIFMDIVEKISNKLVSVDSNGVIAIWSYDTASLRNSGSFAPSRVIYLDLGIVDYVTDPSITPKIKINESDFPPLPDDINGIKLDSETQFQPVNTAIFRLKNRKVDQKGNIIEVFHPVVAEVPPNMQATSAPTGKVGPQFYMCEVTRKVNINLKKRRDSIVADRRRSTMLKSVVDPSSKKKGVVGKLMSSAMSIFTIKKKQKDGDVGLATVSKAGSHLEPVTQAPAPAVETSIDPVSVAPSIPETGKQSELDLSGEKANDSIEEQAKETDVKNSSDLITSDDNLRPEEQVITQTSPLSDLHAEPKATIDNDVGLVTTVDNAFASDPSSSHANVPTVAPNKAVAAFLGYRLGKSVPQPIASDTVGQLNSTDDKNTGLTVVGSSMSSTETLQQQAEEIIAKAVKGDTSAVSASSVTHDDPNAGTITGDDHGSTPVAPVVPLVQESKLNGVDKASKRRSSSVKPNLADLSLDQEIKSVEAELGRVVSWSQRAVKEIRYESRIEQVAMSPDGCSLLFLSICSTNQQVSPLSPVSPSNVSESLLSPRSVLSDSDSILSPRESIGIPSTNSGHFYCIVAFHLQKLEIIMPVIRFTLPAGDRVLRLSSSVVALETLAQVIRVHTLLTIRIFSTVTGKEISCKPITSVNGRLPEHTGPKIRSSTNSIENVTFPLRLTDLLPGGKLGSVTALCASNRVMAAASIEDNNIVVFNLSHDMDGVEATKSDLFASQAKTAWGPHYDPRSQEATKMGLVPTIFTHLNLPPALSEIIREEEVHFVSEYLDSIMLDVFEEVDRRKRWRYRRDMIEEIFDSSTELGVLGPTLWPPLSEFEYVPKYELYPELQPHLSESKESLGENTAGEDHLEASRKEAERLLTHGLATIVVAEVIDLVMLTASSWLPAAADGENLNPVQPAHSEQVPDAPVNLESEPINLLTDQNSESSVVDSHGEIDTKPKEFVDPQSVTKLAPISESAGDQLGDDQHFANIERKEYEDHLQRLESNESVDGVKPLSTESSTNHLDDSPGKDTEPSLQRQRKFDLHQRIMHHKTQRSFNT